MTAQNRRLLVEINAEIREINRRTINAVFTEMGLADLRPIIQLAAEARANYLRALYDIGISTQPGVGPTDADIQRLEHLRHIYEELVTGTQALETAIEREYLDVDTSKSGPHP